MKKNKKITVTIITILFLVFLLSTKQTIYTNSFSPNSTFPSQEVDPIILIDDDSDFASYPG
jgi:uncharacterized protein YpmB